MDVGANRSPVLFSISTFRRFDVMQTDYELVASAYSSFNARDIDSVLRTMHNDVDWPNGMEGGRVNGHRGVREYWIRQWSSVDPHVEPVSFTTDSDGRIRVQVHQTVRDLSGKVILDQMIQHIYLIRNGLIQSMEIRSGESS
jgi:hypothetical protein